jgi:zinc D-Ala-D-Ala carboxypeptidase
MNTPLVPIQILSVYRSRAGQRVLLPSRMACCTPDTAAAIAAIEAEVEAAGGELLLSDLFRSYDMQLQAHLDYTSGKKRAFSPAPGGSMHEAGRAFDLDLGSLGVPLERFWGIAARHGVTPIIRSPDPSASEAWHFDCRGSHDRVYAYYASGKGTNLAPYQAMAASAILAAGLRHDLFAGREREALLQSMLIRLGDELGNIDGQIGMRTRAALAKAGLQDAGLDAAVAAAEDLVQSAYAGEYRVTQALVASAPVPAHVIG